MNEIEEKTIVPYDYRFEEEWEGPPTVEPEPEIVEGEFYEMPPGEEDEKKAKRRRQLEKEVGKKRVREQEVSGLREKAEREELRKEIRRYRRQYRPGIPEMAKKIQTIATLGGVPRIRKETRELYVPRAPKGMYVPTGMRRLTQIGGEAETTLQEVTMPKLGRLQRAGAPVPVPTRAPVPVARAMALPSRPGVGVPSEGLISVKGQTVSLGLLREITMPKGLMPVERYAYAEIVGNGDSDTFKNVVSELAALGISRRDAEQAIKALLQKGLVRRTQDFRGEESALEVVR